MSDNKMVRAVTVYLFKHEKLKEAEEVEVAIEAI
jgi:hypothetical protein